MLAKQQMQSHIFVVFKDKARLSRRQVLIWNDIFDFDSERRSSRRFFRMKP